MCGLKTISNNTNKKVCRSCRREITSEKSLNLHGNYKSLSGKSKYLVEIFQECTGVDLRRDPLRKRLCQKCASILIAAYEFKLMTQVSQRALMVEHVQTVIKREIIVTENVKKINDDKSLKDDDTKSSADDKKESARKKYVRKHKSMWKAYRCPAFGCNLIFRFNNDLRKHLTEVKGTQSHIFVCYLCDKTFGTKECVRRHLHQFHKEFECTQCKILLYGRNTLYTHRRKMHGSKNDIICPECGKNFSTNDVLKRHINGVHRKILQFECHICGQRCLTSSNLRTHLLIHTDRVPFVCAVCHKSFKQQRNLKLHLQTHVSGNNFECDICHLMLKTKGYLREHRKLHFTSASEYKCDKCEGSFKRASYLREHKKLVHSQTERVTCATCNATYSSKKFLIIHMRQHTNGGYSCHSCGKTFNQKHVLRDHIIAVHEKVKNFACEYEGCEKKYFTGNNLNYHVKTIHFKSF